MKRKIPPLVHFLLAAFFIMLLPGFSLGIMPMDTRGERIIYLSSVFSSLLLAYLIVKLLHQSKRLLWGTSLCLLVFFQLALYRSNTSWKEAGEIARNLLRNLQKIESHHVCIINLPDSLRGAYIYRNGLQQAVSLFSTQHNQERRIDVFSYQYLETPDDKTVISQQEDTHSYHIQLENSGAYFVNIVLPDKQYLVTDTIKKGFNTYPKNYILYPGRLLNECELYFYSEGRLHSLVL